MVRIFVREYDEVIWYIKTLPTPIAVVIMRFMCMKNNVVLAKKKYGGNLPFTSYNWKILK